MWELAGIGVGAVMLVMLFGPRYLYRGRYAEYAAAKYLQRGVNSHFQGGRGARNLERAIAQSDKAIQQNPKNSLAYVNRAIAWTCRGEREKALADFAEALRLKPDNAYVHGNRAWIWEQAKEYDRAIDDLTEGIRLSPRDWQLLWRRGTCWLEKKDYERSLMDLEAAVSINGRNPDLLVCRAMAWHAKGDHVNAFADSDKALWLNRKCLSALNCRAWIQATSPDESLRDGEEAVRDAKRACQLTGWKSSYSLGVLAAASAEVGDFASAIHWVEQARGMDEEFKELRGEMLRCFEEGRAFVDRGAAKE